jgi:hypothetical protein
VGIASTCHNPRTDVPKPDHGNVPADGQARCDHWDGSYSSKGYFCQALMRQNELIGRMGIKKVIADAYLASR